MFPAKIWKSSDEMGQKSKRDQVNRLNQAKFHKGSFCFNPMWRGALEMLCFMPQCWLTRKGEILPACPPLGSVNTAWRIWVQFMHIVGSWRGGALRMSAMCFPFGMGSWRCWLCFPPRVVDTHDWATEQNEKIMERQKEWHQFSCNRGIIHLETKQFTIVSSEYILVY